MGFPMLIDIYRLELNWAELVSLITFVAVFFYRGGFTKESVWQIFQHKKWCLAWLGRGEVFGRVFQHKKWCLLWLGGGEVFGPVFQLRGNEGRGFRNCGLEKRAGLPSGVSLCYSELYTAAESHANATPVFHHHNFFKFFYWYTGQIHTSSWLFTELRLSYLGYTHTYTRARAHTHTHAQTHSHTYTCTDTHTHLRVHAQTRSHTHTHAHTHTQTLHTQTCP